MIDPRDPRGVRHKLAALLTLSGLAVAAGCHGPHAIAEFAKSLSPGQLRRLRCRRQPGQPRQYEVPCECTFRRLLKKVDSQELKTVVVDWMRNENPKLMLAPLASRAGFCLALRPPDREELRRSPRLSEALPGGRLPQETRLLGR